MNEAVALLSEIRDELRALRCDLAARRRVLPMCAPVQTVDGAALYAILSNR